MTLEENSHNESLPTSGIPNFDAFSANIFVPFEVKRIHLARMLWLNERWFAEQDVDISQPEVYGKIAKDLVEVYGVTTEHKVPRDAISDLPHIMFAERYGGTGGTGHGGSGRCGTFGHYNAKGVGRTPLTPDYADWSHAHGCLSMTEALREAINAEVAAAELPYGAVPVVAIIDTGLEFCADQDGLAERRVILVRPNFVRPAHFERSIFFGSSGTSGSDQYIDACRVRDVIQAVSSHSDPSKSQFFGLRQYGQN